MITDGLPEESHVSIQKKVLSKFYHRGARKTCLKMVHTRNMSHVYARESTGRVPKEK